MSRNRNTPRAGFVPAMLALALLPWGALIFYALYDHSAPEQITNYNQIVQFFDANCDCYQRAYRGADGQYYGFNGMQPLAQINNGTQGDYGHEMVTNATPVASEPQDSQKSRAPSRRRGAILIHNGDVLGGGFFISDPHGRHDRSAQSGAPAADVGHGDGLDCGPDTGAIDLDTPTGAWLIAPLLIAGLAWRRRK